MRRIRSDPQVQLFLRGEKLSQIAIKCRDLIQEPTILSVLTKGDRQIFKVQNKYQKPLFSLDTDKQTAHTIEQKRKTETKGTILASWIK